MSALYDMLPLEPEQAQAVRERLRAIGAAGSKVVSEEDFEVLVSLAILSVSVLDGGVFVGPAPDQPSIEIKWVQPS